MCDHNVTDGWNCDLILVMMAKEKPPITVVGDVGGRIAIIVVRNSFLLLYVISNDSTLDVMGLPSNVT